ncbi:MAG: hypothetical protein LBC39_06610 [Methanobrevibacter sp.]|jgi:hypothetical protein|nr:hypothetical protein [Candidatus Methanovirga aequatorialis]
MDFRQYQKIFSIFFAIIFIGWGLFTIYSTSDITHEDLALNFIIVIVGVAYPLVIFKTYLSKILLLVEGILLFSIGMIYLTFYPKILFCGIGTLLVTASVFINHKQK